MPREAAPADLASVRQGLSASTDPRAANTRARIMAAVATLASDDRDFSVKAVVAEAGVSRATFYTHFAGLEDLALQLQEQAFHEIAASTRDRASGTVDASSMEHSQRRLIAHYAAYRSLYAGAFAVAVPRGTESRVARLMQTEILAHICETSQPPSGIVPAIAATYIAHAATGLIASWVMGEIDATEDELARHLTQLMPSWMHTGIPSPAGDPDGSRRKKNTR